MEIDGMVAADLRCDKLYNGPQLGVHAVRHNGGIGVDDPHAVLPTQLLTHGGGIPFFWATFFCSSVTKLEKPL